MQQSVEMLKQLESNTTTQEQDLREKHSKESPLASRGYCLKLARHLMRHHKVDFDEKSFCQQHGIYMKG